MHQTISPIHQADADGRRLRLSLSNNKRTGNISLSVFVVYVVSNVRKLYLVEQLCDSYPILGEQLFNKDSPSKIEGSTRRAGAYELSAMSCRAKNPERVA